MVFDFNLKLEKIFPMEYYLNEMAMDGNYIYGLRHNSMDDSGYEIISIAKDSLASSPNIVLSTPISVRGRKAMGKSMVSNQGSIYASIPFDNKICKLKDGKVTESYIIDFGGQGLPNRPIEKDMSPETFDRLYSDTHWSMVNMSGSDSLMLFNTNRSTQFILNQKIKNAMLMERYIMTCCLFPILISHHRKDWRTAWHMNRTGNLTQNTRNTRNRTTKVSILHF